MAHILFISYYYPPEKAAAAVCISENAKRLVKMGHQVTVLTTVPNYPTGIVPPEYRGRLIQREVLDGVHVTRIWSYISPNKGFLRRILAHFSFGCLAALLGQNTVDHPDVIIVESHPLFNAISARLLAWLKRCPLIFMVSDLWPESAIQLGVLRNPVLIWLAEWLEWSTYQRASLVWVVTEGIYNTLIRRGLSPERIFLLTNGVDTAKFHPFPQAQARLELGWDHRFTVVYAGTHGISHGLTTILDAAEQIRDHEDIHIILVGDGAEKTKLIAEAQKRELRNITFLDPLPHESVPMLLSAADVCLAHARKVLLFQGMLPIKMFEAMACARPILLALDGEARRVAEKEAGAAMYVEPEDANALASAILYLYEHREQAELLGQHGRTYVEEHFDYTKLASALDARIAALTGRRDATTSAKSAPITMSMASLCAEIPKTPLSTSISVAVAPVPSDVIEEKN
jgi:colanic acid biosynthesis glycosyl transferase WcaI